VELVVSYATAKRSSEQHDYQLLFSLRNNGEARINKYQMEIEFPAIFLSLTNTFQPQEVRERKTATHRTFRVSEMNFTDALIFQGDTKRLFALDYSINNEIYDDPSAMNDIFTVAVRCENQPPRVTTFYMKDFQKF
jgi:hypothetical protein